MHIHGLVGYITTRPRRTCSDLTRLELSPLTEIDSDVYIRVSYIVTSMKGVESDRPTL
jgi:hypothetical protein